VIRTLALIKRRADLDRDAFREHYEETHVPLARPLLSGLVRYVRYHVVAEPLGELGHDVLTAFWYRDVDAARGVLETMEGEAGRAVREDELTFMDKPANSFFSVSERPLVAGDEGREHLFVLVRRPPEATRFDTSTRLVRDHWPRLLAGFGAVDFALLRDAFPVEGRPLLWDAVLQVRAAAYPGLDEWAASMRAEGHGVAAARTRAFETALGAG
jgi:uncharacterized protein (TIGR02118 family)